MAHFEKYTVAQTRQEINHDRRRYTSKRDNIDASLTHKNYNLVKHNVDPWEFVKQKIDMSKKSGGRFNSRSVSCVSCVISLPADFQGDESLFFKVAKQHLDSVFGAENCISAWVHYDEPGARPHLHYKATPVLVNDAGVHQFNAKAIVSRSFLRRFHKDLESAMKRVFGRPVGIINGATKYGNLTVSQLKEQRALLVQLNKDYCSLLNEYNDLVDEYNKLLESVDNLKARHQDLVERVAGLKSKLEDLEALNHRVANSVLGDDDFEFDEFER